MKITTNEDYSQGSRGSKQTSGLNLGDNFGKNSKLGRVSFVFYSQLICGNLKYTQIGKDDVTKL